jgi:hypothetical protein
LAAALFFFTKRELCAQTSVMLEYLLVQNSGWLLQGCVFFGLMELVVLAVFAVLFGDKLIPVKIVSDCVFPDEWASLMDPLACPTSLEMPAMVVRKVFVVDKDM